MKPNNVLAIIAVLGGALLVTTVLLVRRPTPQTIIAVPAPGPIAASPATVTAPGTPAPPATGNDSDLAENSTDPFFTGFIGSFKTSSTASCKTALQAKLQTTDPAAAQRMEDVCSCASNRVAASITIGEARSASASAFSGDMKTNPTMALLGNRFGQAGKACMSEKLGKPAAP